jgi:sugar phosphate permease
MCGGLAFLVADPRLAIALISVTFLGHQSWSTNIHTAITEITPRRHVGTIYGLTGAAGTVIGALMQPVIGRVVDAAGYGPAFAYAGAVYIAAILLLQAAGRIERIRRLRPG